MNDIFDNAHQSELWYHPVADKIFLFHKATLFTLPCLEGNNGNKMIVDNPHRINNDLDPNDGLLIYIGEL